MKQINNRIEVISMITNLSRYGGAQKVLMDIHEGLKEKYDCKILGFQDYDTLHSKYNISVHEYKKNSIKCLRNKVVLVHARNIIPFLVILNKIFFLRAKIVYVSHSVYSTHRNLTLFPKNIVSISNKVTSNLFSYFKIKGKKVNLIYNGIKDSFNPNLAIRAYKGDGKIKILYAGRVNAGKRQVEIVNRLDGLLDDNIEIHFAGVGDDFEKLKSMCANSRNFFCLGFVSNMEEIIYNYDFLMLYSMQEGLPIALLEGIMCGKPLLVNDVGGNLEIGIPNFNSIELLDDWDDLIYKLNSLNELKSNEYLSMSKNSRSLYLKQFRYENMISSYEGLINEIAEGENY